MSVQCENMAIQMNRNITNHDKLEEIDLTLKYTPHITLYLTYFDNSKLIYLENTLIELVKSNEIEACNIELLPTIVICDNYVMWQVMNSTCLQQLSDLVVNQTNSFVTKSARTNIPAWVNSLPKDIRDSKIDMIHRYGSPNVFSQFEPHVTLSYSKNNDTNVVHNYVHPSTCNFQVFEIRIGKVGNYGTVLRGGDIFFVPIPYNW